MNYRPAVGAAIFNKDGHIWLGKRYGKNGLFSWQMPQGGIDKGETPEFAVKREVYEETGISDNLIIKIGGNRRMVILQYSFSPSKKRHG